MKCTVFYRSREDSAQIASSAKFYFDRKKITGLDVEFINLDKRNYKKYLANLSEEGNLPSVVYLWHDEEIVEEFISENYSEIRKEFYRDAFLSDKNASYLGVKNCTKLESRILDDYRDTFKPVECYTINADNTIEKVTIVDFETNIKTYPTKKEAKAALIEKIQSALETCDVNIKSAEGTLEFYKKKKKGLEAKLKQLK